MTALYNHCERFPNENLTRHTNSVIGKARQHLVQRLHLASATLDGLHGPQEVDEPSVLGDLRKDFDVWKTLFSGVQNTKLWS
jgi:hypothetical protein